MGKLLISYLGFFSVTVTGVDIEWCQKKHPVHGSSVGRIALVIREVKEEYPDWIKLKGMLG